MATRLAGMRTLHLAYETNSTAVLQDKSDLSSTGVINLPSLASDVFTDIWILRREIPNQTVTARLHWWVCGAACCENKSMFELVRLQIIHNRSRVHKSFDEQRKQVCSVIAF